MKTPKLALIELVCSKDPTRPALSLPYLDTSGATPILIATNGHALAAIDVEADKAEQGYVPVAALKHARKVGKKDQPAEIALNHVCTMADGAQLPRSIPETWRFPAQWREVVPKDPAVLRLAFNPALLAKLAEALGSADHVVLEIPAGIKPKDSDKAFGPIRVFPRDGKGFGAIMRIPVPSAAMADVI